MSNITSTQQNDRDKLSRMELEKYNFITRDQVSYRSQKGISEAIVEDISKKKDEPKWMLNLRLNALRHFLQRPLPEWGPNLHNINFEELTCYLTSDSKNARSWDDVPTEIKETFEKMGVPEAERKYLAGSVAQYESNAVYHNLQEKWARQGVIFTDLDTAVQEHPDIVKKYFMNVVPISDNKFSALHAAFWSGGSFVYVPQNVKVNLPLQAYYRMNASKEGQFEHTLIIAEPHSRISFIEGCAAPKYPEYSLHSAVVEIYAKEHSDVRYTTVQNWSKNVYNLNTKRALVDAHAKMDWVGASLGSYVTMLYPCSILRGEFASASHLNIAFSTSNTWKDGGAKVIHAAPNTKSTVIAKSISMGGGTSVYRGLLRINPGALNASSYVCCSGLILDDHSKSYAFPHNEIHEPTASIAHEATVNKISDEQIFYLTSRGLTESEARNLIVMGFLSDISRELPLEYAVEFSRLVSLELDKLGTVG